MKKREHIVMQLLSVQQMTMAVGGGDFVDDGMAMAYATGGHHDAGDSDVFVASMSRRQLLSGSVQRSAAEVSIAVKYSPS